MATKKKGAKKKKAPAQSARTRGQSRAAKITKEQKGGASRSEAKKAADLKAAADFVRKVGGPKQARKVLIDQQNKKTGRNTSRAVRSAQSTSRSLTEARNKGNEIRNKAKKAQAQRKRSAPKKRTSARKKR